MHTDYLSISGYLSAFECFFGQLKEHKNIHEAMSGTTHEGTSGASNFQLVFKRFPDGTSSLIWCNAFGKSRSVPDSLGEGVLCAQTYDQIQWWLNHQQELDTLEEMHAQPHEVAPVCQSNCDCHDDNYIHPDCEWTPEEEAFKGPEVASAISIDELPDACEALAEYAAGQY